MIFGSWTRSCMEIISPQHQLQLNANEFDKRVQHDENKFTWKYSSVCFFALYYLFIYISWVCSTKMFINKESHSWNDRYPFGMWFTTSGWWRYENCKIEIELKKFQRIFFILFPIEMFFLKCCWSKNYLHTKFFNLFSISERQVLGY